MALEGKSNIPAIVARFFERRRKGERVSIDEVLAGFDDVADTRVTRSKAVQLISHEARMASRRRPDNVGASGPLAGEWAEAGFPAIDGYDLIDFVGQGGMGIVYEAYQQATGRRVAIKVMREVRTFGDAARRRFEREVELVARLQHPGIVAIVDSGVHRGNYFYVMDYVEGCTLDEACGGGQRDLRGVLTIIAEICDAVDYAHQRGVLHRDLKPANILVDAQSRPHVLDFGLAKQIDTSAASHAGDSLSVPGLLIGTLAYMSPEQARGDLGQIGVRSDVYALGVIAYQLVAGEFPYLADGPPRDVLNLIVQQDPAPPTALVRKRGPALGSKASHVAWRRSLFAHSGRSAADADLDAILLKALEKEPLKRYATASEMAEDIRRWLDGHIVHARRAGRVERFWRWCQRNPMAATAAGLMLGIVAAGPLVAVREASLRRRAEELLSERENLVIRLDPRYDQAIQDKGKPFEKRRSGPSRLSRTLLEAARAHYEPFVQALAQQSGHQEELAHAYCGLAILTREVGTQSEAIRLFEQACRLLDRLALDNPHAPRFRAELYRCYTTLSVAQLETGELKAAEHSTRQAQRIRETLGGTLAQNSMVSNPGMRAESNRHAGETRAADAQAELARLQQAIQHQLAAFSQSPRTNQDRRLLRDQFAQFAAQCDEFAQPDAAGLAAVDRYAHWPDDPIELYYVACSLARLPALLAEQ